MVANENEGSKAVPTLACPCESRREFPQVESFSFATWVWGFLPLNLSCLFSGPLSCGFVNFKQRRAAVLNRIRNRYVQVQNMWKRQTYLMWKFPSSQAHRIAVTVNTFCSFLLTCTMQNFTCGFLHSKQSWEMATLQTLHLHKVCVESRQIVLGSTKIESYSATLDPAFPTKVITNVVNIYV